MEIGVPKEVKDNENRVAMTPDGVEALVSAGHTVSIEENAGDGSFYTDDDYAAAGAAMVDAEAAWDADLVVKIKEPLEQEYGYLDDETVLFTYFHLAADEGLTQEVLDSGMTAIAYETVEKDGSLPLLDPMSEVAGEMAPLMGAYYLARFNQGKGILLPEGEVTVIGGGTVGESAAHVAAGMGADVTVLEIDDDRIDELNELPYDNLVAKESTEDTITAELQETDVLVGAVLVPGAEAPTVVSEEMVKSMEPGSVIVDVAVDQGGCVATTRPTSHSDPVYEEHGVIHYAVTNMPGAYAQTATNRITAATLPYVQAMADRGWKDALKDDPVLMTGLNAYQGTLTNEAVAEAFDLDWEEPENVL